MFFSHSIAVVAWCLVEQENFEFAVSSKFPGLSFAPNLRQKFGVADSKLLDKELAGYRPLQKSGWGLGFLWVWQSPDQLPTVGVDSVVADS